jgi:hypothetical protein
MVSLVKGKKRTILESAAKSQKGNTPSQTAKCSFESKLKAVLVKNVLYNSIYT